MTRFRATLLRIQLSPFPRVSGATSGGARVIGQVSGNDPVRSAHQPQPQLVWGGVPWTWTLPGAAALRRVPAPEDVL